jgi:hypothetical protein
MKDKNFIIVGSPRSGTTFLCDILNGFEDIWIPEYPNYEPFNPNVIKKVSATTKNNAFDHDAIVKKFISYKSNKNAKYFGFKTFLSFHSDLRELIKNNDLDVIIILRKDIWKVMGSMLIAVDNNDYIGSSKKYQPYIFERTSREKRRILTSFNQLCRVYWELENVFSKNLNIIDKFYFEDLIKYNRRLPIEEYFEREIVFDHKYNDNDDISKYIGNFQEMKDFILEEVHQYQQHYSALPSYISQLLK